MLSFFSVSHKNSSQRIVIQRIIKRKQFRLKKIFKIKHLLVCGVQENGKPYFQNITSLQSSRASTSYGSEDFTQLFAQN